MQLCIYSHVSLRIVETDNFSFLEGQQNIGSEFPDISQTVLDFCNT